MRSYLLTKLYTVLLLSILCGCQSTRPFVVPATNAYGGQAASQNLTASTNQSQPILSAAVPNREITGHQLEAEAQQNEPIAALHVVRSLMPPDTSSSKKLPLVLSGKPDLATTIVNSIGGATTAVGLGLVIFVVSTDAPSTEWGGLSHAITFLGGLVALSIGLALLFFQGKNGRLRRLREARRMEAVPAIPPVAEQSSEASPVSAKPTGHGSRSKKTGRVLLVIGGVLGVLGFTFTVILLLPAIILLLLGAIFSIARS